MNKEYKIKLDLNKKLYNKKMAFNQFDENVNDFYIEVTKNNEVVKDLDKSIVTLVAIKPNNTVDAQFIEVKEGQIYADLKPSMCDLVGNYQAKAMIVLEGEIVTTDTINYSVNEDKIISRLNEDVISDERFTLFTDALARLSDIEASEEQRMINEAERILSEENRKIEEAKRVEAELIRQHEEADRTKYDATRESNENIRKQNESIRLANETNRIDEEAKRVEEENKRKLAEEERNANYNFMTEDEERRRSEANAHKEAEALRVQAETNRVNEEAKRRTTEQARVSAENTRVSNENTRKANETTRQNNETKRVEAETQRQNRYNSFITDAEANANNFENYTNAAKVKEEERKANELDRKSQEDRRVSNEVERISNENSRKANEEAREKNETSRQYVFENKVNEVDKKIVELNATKDNFVSSINTKVDTKISELDTAKSDMTTTVSNKIDEVEARFNALTSSQQQDAEVIDARDGETSLKARLDRDLYKDGISLSDRIEAIEGLKDSQNMKYETDKGYLVCKETKNGVIDDLKIEGKTLVNLFDKNKSWTQGKHKGVEGQNLYKQYEVNKSSNNTYHIIASIGDKTSNSTDARLMIYAYNTVTNSSSKLILDSSNNSNDSINKVITLTNDEVLLFNCWDISEDKFNKNYPAMMILEGDHTQNPPSYFEGLMSVGQDVDKIEVLSRKEDGNLFDVARIVDEKESGVDYTYDNNNVVTVKSNAALGFGNYMKFKAGKTYYFSGETSNIVNVRIYPVGRYTYADMILSIAHEQDSFSGSYKCTQDMDVMFRFWKNTGLATISDVIVSTNPITEYTPYQSDKKQILFYNSNGELEPIQELHEWDSIEKHSDNKWYYHKRSGKVVLNGSESFSLQSDFERQETTIGFSLAGISDGTSKEGLAIGLSDRFPVKAQSSLHKNDEEGFTQGYKILYFRINKSKLSTQDVQGFKAWLQANNVTVVYQLAQEKVYELAPLHLDSYANETLILCNSGAISPKMEFSITSHINELVKAYGERINLLEEKVYKYMVTQNRMQLASTYSADSVTFKVDYFSLCGDEENYDEDLYNLILNNILVGKDNYNYDKMFTIILDYASWNQISWEQFDILVGLMDIQHNPPVEELPTEDIIEEDIIENEETPVE